MKTEPTGPGRDLTAFLRGRGADLVGFADLSTVPAETTGGLGRGVSLAMKLPPEVVAGIVSGPTQPYADQYASKNAALTELAESAAALLREKGFAARARPASGDWDRDTFRAPVQHKTVARLAGLGWIGRCALLVTERYGAAVRFASILTDAPLEPLGEPGPNRCGTCDACVRICPGGAPTGRKYEPGMEREEIFDPRACAAGMKKVNADRELTHRICGMCIANCPWTQHYLRASGV